MAASSATRLFNDLITACAIAAAAELGLFDALQEEEEAISAHGFANRHGLDTLVLDHLLLVLASDDIVTLDSRGDDVRVGRGSSFMQVCESKGYFLWAVRGYGHLLTNLGSLASTANRVGDFVRRDSAAIGSAGDDYGRRFVDRQFFSLAAGLAFDRCADLGCGAGTRLIRTVAMAERRTGVGIDFAMDVVRQARGAVAAAGLADRIQIVHGDVRAASREGWLNGVDLAFSFFLGHDLWPFDDCVEFLRGLREIRGLRTLLLCDTCRSGLGPGSSWPIFSLGFELLHTYMGKYVPSREEWNRAFEASGWICRSEHVIDIAFSSIFVLQPA
jgi:phenylpyruvate C(3)-methyltransferase